MNRLRNFRNKIKPRGGWRYPAIIISGAFVGLFAYTFFASRAYSYLSNDPATCVNCHIMGPYYATWMHSSHGRNTTCNDCHVPQDSKVKGYYFKAVDGLRHSAIFTIRGENQAIQAIEASSQVIMDNCIRCHTQLNTEFVKIGRMDFKEVKNMGGNACWDCHRNVPHTLSRSLSSTPNARVPMPESNVPEWLHNMVKRSEMNNTNR
ncbi:MULTISPECIES: cytochrome c nitrite reductase small subunit [Proteiniphilum]|jgi:cytochrome c nitrite reductase small subunit|uniref:cytochrome c nitrite reductase small subunit n=1 Tax=Proteiniphilum TaxID=294702 RepID=UPI001EE9E56B|nr:MULTISPECIES: cytochrome c nitrite reductase small subunit [Proteiniphilum]ULB34737.1 cytochrome c nitrite reductase small subunit [Proteiniphilum propionicum]